MPTTLKTIPDAYANLIALLNEKGNMPDVNTIRNAHGTISREDVERLMRGEKIAPSGNARLQFYIAQFEKVKEQINKLITPKNIFKKSKLLGEEEEVLNEMRSNLLRAASYDLCNAFNTKSMYGASKASYLIDTDTYSNFNSKDFLNVTQKSKTFNKTKDSPNLTKFLLEARHKQETSKQTRELIDKPFITYNGIILNSLTKDQLSIIKRLDENLKKGSTAAININLGVGEGKTFLIEVIQAVYGHDPAKRPKDITLKNGAKIGYSLQNNDNLFPSSNNAIFSLSLTDIVGDTKESLKQKLEVIKDAIVQEQAKGKKPLVVFDEFPHLNNDLKSLIRKTLPAECTTAYISATPNVIQLRNSKDPADRTTEKIISTKKEKFITGLQNNSHVVFEKTDVQQENAFEALIRQTTEHLSGKQKAQWILPDLKPEHIRMFLENRVAQIQGTGFQNIIFKNELGEIKYFNEYNELKDYPPEHQDDKDALEKGSCLMVYSSQDAIGGDFDRLSENVGGQIISSINPISTSQMQQWTARNRKRDGTMGEIDYTLIINAPDDNIDKFTQTLRVHENNHEKLDVLGHLENQIVSNLIQKAPGIPQDMPRDIRERFNEKFGENENAKQNFNDAFKKECRRLIKNAIKDNVKPNVLKSYIDKGIQNYLELQFGSSAPKFSANIPTDVVKKISEPVNLYQSIIKSLNPLSIGAVNGGSGLTLEHLKLEKKVESYLSLKAQGTYNPYDNAAEGNRDQQIKDEQDKEAALTGINKKINKIIAAYEKINNSAQGKQTHTYEKLFTDMDTIDYALSVANTFKEDHPALGERIEALETCKAQIDERIKAKGSEPIPAVLQPYAKKHNIAIPQKNVAREEDKAKKSPAIDRMKNDLNKLKDELESLEREIITKQIKKNNPEYLTAIELVTKATKKLQEASLQGLKNEKEYADCQRALNGLAKRIAGIDLKAAQQNLNEAIVKIQPNYNEIGRLQPDRNTLDEPLKIAMNEVEPIIANIAVLMSDINPTDTQEGILKRTEALTEALSTITRHQGTLESGVAALRKADESRLAEEAAQAEEARRKAEEEARLNEMPPIEIIEGTTPVVFQGVVTDIPVPDNRETIEKVSSPQPQTAGIHEHVEPIVVDERTVDPKVLQAPTPQTATITTLPDNLVTAQEFEISNVEPIEKIQIQPQISSQKVQPKDIPSLTSLEDEELVAIDSQTEKTKQPQPKTIDITSLDNGEGQDAVSVTEDDIYEDDFDVEEDELGINNQDQFNEVDRQTPSPEPRDEIEDDEPAVVNINTNQNDEFQPIVVEQEPVNPEVLQAPTPKTVTVTALPDNRETITITPAAQTQTAKIHEQPATLEPVNITNEQTPDAVTTVAQNIEPLKPQTSTVNPNDNFKKALDFFKQRIEQQNGLDNMRGKTADATRVGNFLKARDRFKAELQKAKDMVAAIGDLATLNNISPSLEFAKLSTYVTRLDSNKRVIADLGNTDDYSAILSRSGELQNLTGDLRDYNKSLENILRIMQASPSTSLVNDQVKPVIVEQGTVNSEVLKAATAKTVKVTTVPDNREAIKMVPAAQTQTAKIHEQVEPIQVVKGTIDPKVVKATTPQIVTVTTPKNIEKIEEIPAPMIPHAVIQETAEIPEDVKPLMPIRKPPAKPIIPIPTIPEKETPKETSLFAFDAIMRLKKEAHKNNPSLATTAGNTPEETKKVFNTFCENLVKKSEKLQAINQNKNIMQQLLQDSGAKPADILPIQSLENPYTKKDKVKYSKEDRAKHKLNTIAMYQDLTAKKADGTFTIAKINNGAQEDIVKIQNKPNNSNQVKIDSAITNPDDRACLLMVLSAKDLSKTGKINIDRCENNPEAAIKLYLFAKSLDLKPNKIQGETLKAIQGYDKDEELKAIFERASRDENPTPNKEIIVELEEWQRNKNKPGISIRPGQ